ncbi:OmpA family protein [Thiohalocapsa sp. ML1]|jgi:OmpA-OmpF porin, OOP family|uniref:OmpA family protein n=1 Tax=Thiohalocapsa sp. ML1 TaxID=1431688 RepID=UPI0007321555|nr:OmpA family protein [Thiohalocapsa sp. ML1]
MKRLIITLGCLLLTIGGFLGTAASAQSYLDRNASPTDIKRALQGTRSISRRAPTSAPAPRRSAGASAGTPTGSGKTAVRRAAAGAAVATGAVAAQPLPPSEGDLEEGPASFRIQFAFGSAELHPDAIPLLDKLGEALTSDDLRDWTFVVEGHTDATGDDQFNLSLSQQRADAVRDYLVAKHGIEAERLPTRGYGPSQPFDPDRPAAAINRRVTFAAPEGEADDAVASLTPASADAEPAEVEDVPAAAAAEPAADELVIDTFIETGPAPGEEPPPADAAPAAAPEEADPATPAEQTTGAS